MLYILPRDDLVELQSDVTYNEIIIFLYVFTTFASLSVRLVSHIKNIQTTKRTL